MATGAGRKGILLGPPMGRAVADLILTGETSLALEAFSPARFARATR
jgi:glycine/D-amino acid oxidase-like deaminating enzyme